MDQKSTILDDDVIIFMNFRPDRARQITNAFIDDNFTGFIRKKRPILADFVMTTQYSDEIEAPVAFPPEEIRNSLGEYLSNLGKTQLRIAETEKYAHVTFFLQRRTRKSFQRRVTNTNSIPKS